MKRAGVRESERGAIIVWALIFVVITSAMVVSHTTFLASTRQSRQTSYNRDTLAATMAQSGVSDALGWFQRQPVQPVASFAPELDPDREPPKFDTMDPTLGLVREFEIHGNLWGRYEVRSDEARDISALRGGLPSGSVWEVAVRAFVFRIIDPSMPFDAAPNRLLYTTRLTTEIRTVQFNPSGPAAIVATDPSKVEIGSQGRVRGGGSGAAIAFRDPGSTTAAGPSLDPGSVLEGSPALMPLAVFSTAANDLFSLQLADLRAYCDLLVVPGKSDLPKDASGNTYVEDSIVFFDKAFWTWKTFTFRNCLVIVDGDCSLFPPLFGSSTQTLDGVLYVTGDTYISSNFSLRGSLIGEGKITIGKMTFFQPQLEYDPAVLDMLRELLNRYRQRRGEVPN